MAYGTETPANRSATHYGSTSSKPKPKTKAKGGSGSSGGSNAPKAALFDWGDGKGKVHTIPRQTHQQNVQAQQYGINLDAPLASPIDARTALGEANAGADREYGPQISALQGIQSSLEPWYQQYLAHVTTAQQQAQSYAQPLVAQAQGWANQTAQAAPGIDPSSPAYAQSQQAGQSGQGLAQLGAAALEAIPAALTSYLSGAQAVAAKDLPQAKAYYGQKVGEKQAERGSRVQELYGQARTNAQNYGIAASTLGLNTAKSQADIDIQRGIDPVTGKPLPKDPEKPITSGPFAGLTGSQVTALPSDKRQELIDNYNSVTHPPKAPKDPNAQTPAEKRKAKADEDKRIAGIRQKSGDFATHITDAVGDWNLTSKQPFQLPDTEKIENGKKVKVPGGTRPKTTQEIREQMRALGYTPGEIHIALLRRVGKPLDQAAIDYMHSKGVRIPRDWLTKGTRPKPKTPAEAIPGVGGAAQGASAATYGGS